MEMTHVLEVVGSIYWMDLTFFTLICCKNCTFCLKRLKINEKEVGVGPFFKKQFVFAVNCHKHANLTKSHGKNKCKFPQVEAVQMLLYFNS